MLAFVGTDDWDGRRLGPNWNANRFDSLRWEVSNTHHHADESAKSRGSKTGQWVPGTFIGVVLPWSGQLQVMKIQKICVRQSTSCERTQPDLGALEIVPGYSAVGLPRDTDGTIEHPYQHPSLQRSCLQVLWRIQDIEVSGRIRWHRLVCPLSVVCEELDRASACSCDHRSPEGLIHKEGDYYKWPTCRTPAAVVPAPPW